MPPSPVEIVFVGANDQMPASPHVPARRPFHERAVRVRAVLDQDDPLAAAEPRDPLDVEGDVAADVDEQRRRAAGARATLRSRSSNDMQRSSRLQSTNSTFAPAAWTASGVAMNVFDGQSTVSAAKLEELERGERGARPARRRDRRAGRSRPPTALELRRQRPSDQCSRSSTPSQSACRRARSRWSKPMANESMFMRRSRSPGGRSIRTYHTRL